MGKIIHNFTSGPCVSEWDCPVRLREDGPHSSDIANSSFVSFLRIPIKFKGLRSPPLPRCLILNFLCFSTQKSLSRFSYCFLPPSCLTSNVTLPIKRLLAYAWVKENPSRENRNSLIIISLSLNTFTAPTILATVHINAVWGHILAGTCIGCQFTRQSIDCIGEAGLLDGRFARKYSKPANLLNRLEHI